MRSDTSIMGITIQPFLAHTFESYSNTFKNIIMKTSNTNPKATILFFFYMCTAYMALGQDIMIDSSPKTIDDTNYSVVLNENIKVNANHKYINFFSLQDEEYIKALYQTNLMNMKDHPELMNPAKLVKRSEGNNSLIFTVYKNGVTYMDTLRNSLHPNYEVQFDNGGGFLGIKKWFAKMIAKRHISVASIEGRLPKGGMTWLSAKRTKVEFGIFVPDVKAVVTILLQDKNDNTISIIVDEVLAKGWNNYEWTRGEFPKGKYKISYTMNGKSMTQMFKC